jgi:flagellar basal body-associated protein FliL
MKPENKKIALYVGGAVVVGAIGFFVYSFFQKPIVLGDNTSFDLGNNEYDNKSDEQIVEKNYSKTNTFFSNLQDTVFEPIKTPNVFKSLISANPLQTNLLQKN